jgi:hypothetical protein
VGWVFGLCPLSMKIKVLETGSVSGLKWGIRRHPFCWVCSNTTE